MTCETRNNPTYSDCILCLANHIEKMIEEKDFTGLRTVSKMLSTVRAVATSPLKQDKSRKKLRRLLDTEKSRSRWD